MRLIISFSILNFFLFSLVLPQDFISAQTPFTKESLLGNGQTHFGLAPQSGSSLLDPSRFSMHQSYSMSFISSGNSSDMTGLYLNRLQYDFKVPVTLQVDIGFFHKPMALAGNSETLPGQKNSLLTIPRVGLIYQPSKNFAMSFEYVNQPAGYGSAVMPYSLFSDNPFFSSPSSLSSLNRKGESTIGQ